jgi:hypothetical protein
MAYEDLFEKLLTAETEDVVTRALQDHGLDDFSDEHWTPYGGQENNYGIVGAQQADPLGALVEKIINSIDSVLMRECYVRKLDPFGKDVPQSMAAAAEKFLGVPDGNLARISAVQRTTLAESSISIIFTGNKPKQGNPCLFVVDAGEGQYPADFGSTLVSLMRSNKLRIPFVQGKFNMGGSGSLLYCSPRRNYQLVASRRNTAISNGKTSKWGFTIVRSRPPREGERATRFEYLTPGGSVAEIEHDEVVVLPCSENKPYRSGHKSGTILKLYEYDVRERTVATADFFRSLSLKLWSVAVPVRIIDTRGYDVHTPRVTFSGMNIRLEEDKSDVLEEGFPCSFTLNVPGVGKLEGRICLFKPGTDLAKWVTAREAIIYTLNGQAHGSITRDFFSRKSVDLSWIQRQLLISIDCSQVSNEVRDRLFMTSRDRTREVAEKRLIEDTLAAFLRKHTGLRQWNERRRLQTIEDKLANESQSIELFEQLVKQNPALAEILGLGLKVRIPQPGVVPTPEFKGRQYPSYLRVADSKSGKPFEKECPQNSFCRIVLETDAENDYLQRAIDPGVLLVEPSDALRSDHLFNGRLEIQLEPGPSRPPGTLVPVTVKLSSPDAADGYFQVEGQLKVLPLAPTVVKPPPPPKPPRTAAAALPEIREIYKDKWSEDFEINGEEDVVTIMRDGDNVSSLVNMDNRHLRSYLHANAKRTEEIKNIYKLSVTMMGLWLEDQVKKNEIEEDKRRSIANSLGRLLLPMIDSLGAKLVEIEKSL